MPATTTPTTATESAPDRRATPKPAPVPDQLTEFAFVDGPSAAAAASISISQWHDLVRKGEAPQPAFRRPRCTRWRLADVRDWLIAQAAQPDASDTVIGNATKASKAAHRKRVNDLALAGEAAQ